MNINIFEAFAGIGSQSLGGGFHYNFKINHLGIAEWFLPAIIIYNYLNGDPDNYKIKYNRENALLYLKKNKISINSKKPVNETYWNRFDDDKLKFFYGHIKYSDDYFNNIFDITNFKFDKLIFKEKIDLFTYSFPCQDLSIQGKQKGINEKSKTKSSLLWEIKKILLFLKKHNNLPKYLLLENVPNITSPKHINNLNKWKKILSNLGYYNSENVLNSKDYGVPQNRKRYFLISALNKKIILKNKIRKNTPLTSIIDKKLWSDQFCAQHLYKKYKHKPFKKTNAGLVKSKLKDYTNFTSEAYIYKITDGAILPTLTASGAHSRLKILVNNKLRFINPKEAFLLMGYTSDMFNKFYKKTNKYISDKNIIFAAGNSIPIPVIKNIYLNIFGGEHNV